MRGERVPWRRIGVHGVRTRLTATVTIVFIAAGAALTVAQLLVLRAALALNVHEVGALVVAGSGASGSSTTEGGCTGDCGLATGALPAGLPERLVTGVLRDAALGDLGLLMVFAAVAAALAWWSTRQALLRVGEVTALAREISEHDLSRRLALTGPRDEISELADTLDVMVGRLEAAFAAQERFVANASHELRGPLTATRTALEAPLAQGRFPDEVRPSILRALEANRRSERLITALLQLARSRAAAGPGFVVCDLAQITSTVLETLAEDAEARDLTVTAVAAPPVVRVLGDETLLTQAVVNLVDNAVRHNHAGGRITSTLSIEPAAGGVPATACLTIANTGPSYTDDQARHLLEPFHRGAATRLSDADGRQGLGLGLAIVESVVRAHAGRLLVAPCPEGGLRVELRLPCAPQGSSAEQSVDPHVEGP